MRALRVLLALAVSRLAYLLSRGAERLLGERMPPKRAAAPEPIAVPGGVETPTAVKPADWRLPHPAEIDAARGECQAYGLPNVKICRGPGKGCDRPWQEQRACPDCYLVSWHDKRPSAEIRAAMERGDA